MDIASQGKSRSQLSTTATLSQKEIVPGLDVVRFLAAVMVLIYHLFFWQNGHLPDPASVNWFWRFGWVGVEIFFTLSGFVIASSAEHATPTTFVIGRVVRLAPTVWICASMTLLASLSLAHGNVHQLLTDYGRTVILMPVGNHIDIVYWTLTVEVAFYALVLAVILIKDFEALLKILVAVGLISTAFDAVLGFNVELSRFMPKICHAVVTANGYHTSRLLLLKHGCFFSLGALIWSLGNPRRTWSHSYAVFLAIFVLGGTMEVWDEALRQKAALSHSFSTAPPVIAWLIGLTGIFVSSRYRSNRKVGLVRALRFVGLLTFPLYLIHNNFGLWIRDKLLVGDSHITGATVAAAFAVLGLSAVVTVYLEPPIAKTLRRSLQRLSERVAGTAMEPSTAKAP